MIDVERLTRAEIQVLRDALVTYVASLDKRIERLERDQRTDDLSWRRFLSDELLDALRAR